MLKRRSSLQKSLCPVVLCPYLCSSEGRAKAESLSGGDHREQRPAVGPADLALDPPRRLWNISRARGLTCVCAVFARIRRLRKSPQYILVILQGEGTVSANLRNSPQNFHNSCTERYQSPGSRNSLASRSREFIKYKYTIDRIKRLFR